MEPKRKNILADGFVFVVTFIYMHRMPTLLYLIAF
jgi:hypothetical protein